MIVRRFDSSGRFMMKLEFSDDDYAMIGRKVIVKETGKVGLLIDGPHYNHHYGHSYAKWGIWPLEDRENGLYTCLQLDRNQFVLQGEEHEQITESRSSVTKD